MARKDVIAELQQILIERHRKLVNSLTGNNSSLREMGAEGGGDEVDFAIDSIQDEICSRVAEAESRELAHIQSALERIKEGTYGKCEACNKNIPLPRLQALPFATLCVDCKRQVEEGTMVVQTNQDWSHIPDGPPLDGIRLSEMDFNG